MLDREAKTVMMMIGAGRARRWEQVAVVALLVGALTAGCASSSAPQAVNVVTPTVAVIAPPAAGDLATPAPTGPVVLTLTGLVGATNAGKTLSFDVAGLDRMGLLKVQVYEPWVKQNLTFQGTWLADLLKVARPGPAARGLHLTALDDYQIDLTTAEVQAGGIFLATKRGDGTAIPVEEGGPTRIVFMDGVASGASAGQWIWSLKTIDVR